MTVDAPTMVWRALAMITIGSPKGTSAHNCSSVLSRGFRIQDQYNAGSTTMFTSTTVAVARASDLPIASTRRSSWNVSRHQRVVSPSGRASFHHTDARE